MVARARSVPTASAGIWVHNFTVVRVTALQYPYHVLGVVCPHYLGNGYGYTIHYVQGGSALPAVLIIMLTRDLLGAEQLTGAFLLLYFLAAAPGIVIWRWVSARLGNAVCWLVALGLSVAGFASALALSPADTVLFAVICVITGVTFAADLMLPSAILSERLGTFRLADKATTAYAVLAFLGKASLALAGAVALPLLDWRGFVPAGENDAAALGALLLLYGGLPCVMRLVAMAVLWWHIRLTEGDRAHAY